MNQDTHTPSSTAAVACDACKDTGNHRLVQAREMMFGLRDRFTYQECRACGHLQLLDPPADLERYYPSEYYSLSPPAPPPAGAPRALTRRGTDLLLRLPPRTLDALGQRGPLRPFRMLAGLGLSTRSRVCDVGSGSGELLVRLRSLGFRDLLGIDPYIAADREVAPSVWVRKADIAAMHGSFDAILLNHSLEHMGSPCTVLARLRSRLRPGGAIIVRVPLAGTHAWQHYGSDWVGLDPPRHLFVPTEQSMTRLAQRAGLRVEGVFHDSHALQFWGSEQYRRQIPLHDPESWAESPTHSSYSHKDIARWHRQARKLNTAGRGDSAGFVLRPIDRRRISTQEPVLACAS